MTHRIDSSWEVEATSHTLLRGFQGKHPWLKEFDNVSNNIEVCFPGGKQEPAGEVHSACHHHASVDEIPKPREPKEEDPYRKRKSANS